MKILIYAASPCALVFREAVLLANERGSSIEWGAMICRAPFLHRFDDLISAENRFYLYERFNEIFATDPKIPFLSKSEDNLERSLACDKDGYRRESKEFQHRAAATMLSIFREVLVKFRPDAVLFPPLETVDGVLLLSLCQELGITPLHTVHMRNLGESFFSASLYETPPPYFGVCDDGHRDKARCFIGEFLAGQRGAGQLPDFGSDNEQAHYPRQHFLLRLMRAVRDKLTRERYYRGEDRLLLRIKMMLVRPLYAFRRLRYRLTRDRLFDVTPERGGLPGRFILYAAQVTPEASINTLAQFFVDQERVIDLLRLTMPHGYAVVVKEHPSMAGSRPSSFYRRLRRLSGVVLVSPDVPMRTLIEKADIVSTVTGTVALEAFLLDKPVLMFGRTFFSHLCHLVDKIDGLQDDMRQLIANFCPLSHEEKVEAIARLYAVAYPFAVFEPYYLPQTLARGNIANFLDAICAHMKRLGQVNAS